MTQSRQILIAALVLLAAAFGWLLLGEDGSPPPSAPGVSAGRATEGFGEDYVDPATAQASDPSLEFDESEEIAGGERTEVDLVPTDGRVLRVVDRRNNQPIADAEVFAMDADALRDTPRPPSITHWNEHLVAATRPIHTDADGRVVLPAYRRALLIAARTEDMFGVLRLGRNAPPESTLALRLDEALVVRVLHPDDRPASNTRVVLATTDGRMLDRRAAVATDQDGYAEFPHVWLHRRPAYPTQIAVVELTEQMQAALNEGQALRFEQKPETVTRNGQQVVRMRRVPRSLTPAQRARVDEAQQRMRKFRDQINALRPAMRDERQQGRPQSGVATHRGLRGAGRRAGAQPADRDLAEGRDSATADRAPTGCDRGR